MSDVVGFMKQMDKDLAETAKKQWVKPTISEPQPRQGGEWTWFWLFRETSHCPDGQKMLETICDLHNAALADLRERNNTLVEALEKLHGWFPDSPASEVCDAALAKAKEGK